MQESQKPQRKRFPSRWWIALWIVIALVAVPLIGTPIYIFSANARYETALKDIQAAGLSLDPEDWIVDPVPIEKDAAPAFREAVELARNHEELINEVYFIRWDERTDDRFDLEMKHLLDDPSIIEIIEKLHEASTFPEGHFEHDSTLGFEADLGRTSDVLLAGRLLELEIEYRARKGQLDRVGRSYRALIRLADVFEDSEGAITSYLLATAVRGLAAPKNLFMAANRASEPLTPLIDVLAELQQRTPLEDSLRIMLDTEFFSAVKLVKREVEDGQSMTGKTRFSILARAYMKRNAARVIEFYLDTRTRLDVAEPDVLSAAREVDREVNEAIESFSAWLANDSAVLKLLLPSLWSIYKHCYFSEASLRCMELGIRARLMFAETGTWPSSQQELSAYDGGPVLNDPYTGVPLFITVDGEDLLVYSAGRDRIDHGGKFEDPKIPYRDRPDVGVRVTAGR